MNIDVNIDIRARDAARTDAEKVILLHGLARSAASMEKLARHLHREGYSTVNVDYPSRWHTVDVLAREVIPRALAQCSSEQPVNFVTHSMGGILVRAYLRTAPIPNLKHIVLLGPPNQGSEVVDRLARMPGFKAWNGPAGLQLGTGQDGVPRQIGPTEASVGVIAGSRSINFLLSTMLPGANDGKVSVESTKLEGMRDHITLPVTHPMMMRNGVVLRQVQHYLRHGTFYRAE